jgi:DNA processing protein
MDIPQLKKLLLLSSVPGIGSSRLRILISKFGSLEQVFHASRADLAGTPNIGEKLAEGISAFIHSPKIKAIESKVDAQLTKLDALKAQIITLWDDHYPQLLKEIYDPPAYLFIRGNLNEGDSKSIAIVGTRYPTDYGKNATRKFGMTLAQHQLTIVSGLAFGVDTLAHTSALEAGGRTIAVLGSGIDKIYTDPKGKLYPKIIEHGAIISEEWIGSEPIARNFPKRNRIITGLAKGVLIVESDYKGGSLISANYALDQNRDVFALPGSIFSQKSNGTNALIRDSKAKLVLSPEDILSDYHPSKGQLNLQLESQAMPLPTLSTEEMLLFSFLGSDPIHIDALAEKSGLDLSEVLVLLFELEFKNLIRQSAGKFFQRAF